MNENQQAINAMRAVTISREYGSGGGEIAARLARRLGWQLIDHQIVAQAASELGVHETVVQAHDEHVGGVIARIFQWPYPTSPVEALGPAAGLSRYPGQPADSPVSPQPSI